MPENFRSCVSLILKILSQVSFEKMNKMCYRKFCFSDIKRNANFFFDISNERSLQCLNNMSLKSFMCC